MNVNERHPEWTDRLSDYLTGDLSETERDSVEGHLSECGACRRVLEELRDVVARAGSLGGIEPPRDLWGGIAATIMAPAPTLVDDDAKVIALPTADSGAGVDERVGRPRLTFTVPQLAAASIALVVTSALGTWLASPGLGVQAAGPGGSSEIDGVSMVTQEVDLPEGLAEELSTLESVLTEARTTLDPNTVRVLERNLAVIERAIEDSRSALAQDPGNEFLSDHLTRVYERKIEYLRDVTRVAEWVS